MAISDEVKEEFRNLLEDLVKEIKKTKEVTKGKEIRINAWPHKNLGQIVRDESVFKSSLIAEATLHVNEGVSIKVYEEPAYAPVEKVQQKYEGGDKFVEINVYKEFLDKKEE